MPPTRTRAARALRALVLPAFALAAVPAEAVQPKDPAAPLAAKEFFRPELYISTSNVPLADAIDRVPNRAAWDAFLAERGDDTARGSIAVFIDPRSGAATNIVQSVPLIPGRGVGNRITLASVGARLGRAVRQVDADVVAETVRAYVIKHADVLGIDVAQLGPMTAAQANPDLWHVRATQVVDGVPVRHAVLVAMVSHGNLVVMGTETWGNGRVDTRPRLQANEATARGFAFADGWSSDDVMVRQPQLEIIPFAPPEQQNGDAFAGAIGTGYGYRLAWTFVFQRPPDLATWEVKVDAHDGEVLAFEDINHYQERRSIVGGVYPSTNTDVCPNPEQCGTMQPNSPMPFANTGFPAPNDFTNSGGVYNYTSGTAATTLVGRYVGISDTCGAVNVSSATGNINMGGATGDHDCIAGQAGNTPASRSAFYEVNKLVEQARGYLPLNAWLLTRVPTNVNITSTCNAFYSTGNGSINFYRSGGGCRNTGEIGAVFDHEWGHAIDDNDTGGSLSNSSEGYADIAAIYRLQTSCVGHGFFLPPAGSCGLTADGTGRNANEAQTGPAHCALDCSGVRDSDWDKHADHLPDTPTGFVCSSCNSGGAPCGRQVHCAAAPSRQAAWDFVARDLVAAPLNLDSQSAFIVGNKLFYQGSGLIASWHSCTCGGTSDGCGSTNGYMGWLVADDDNGDLSDGTPHMTALFAAFNRHNVACATPTPQNSGCGGGFGTATATVTATPGTYLASLSWTPVAGATRYWVYRTEGFPEAGCNFGKALIATVNAPATSYVDTQVAVDRTYYYNVVAAGASSACYSRASNCASVTPVSGPDFSFSCAPASIAAQQGGTATSTCTVTSINDFAAPVSLACSGLPAGVTCGYDPNPVTPPVNGSASSTLTVSVTGAVLSGTYGFQATGQNGPSSRAQNISLQVTPAGDFALAATPATQSVRRGRSIAYTLTLTPEGGFNGNVTLSAVNLPPGASVSFSPATLPGSGTSTMTVFTARNSPRGTFTVTARGQSPPLVHDTTVQLTVTK